MSTTNDVTIPYTQYRSLVENTAEHHGEISGRSIDNAGDFFHPGDPLGQLLCDVWMVRPDSAGLTLAAYMAALDKECDRRGIERPGFEAVIDALPMAINTNRYPDVDVAKLIATVRREVPEYYSDAS